MSNPVVYKLSFNASQEVYEALGEIAAMLKVSMAQAIREAIGTEKYLLDEVEKGNKVLIEKRCCGRFKEVILR
jgi:hypothetical protein